MTGQFSIRMKSCRQSQECRFEPTGSKKVNTGPQEKVAMGAKENDFVKERAAQNEQKQSNQKLFIDYSSEGRHRREVKRNKKSKKQKKTNYDYSSSTESYGDSSDTNDYDKNFSEKSEEEVDSESFVPKEYPSHRRHNRNTDIAKKIDSKRFRPVNHLYIRVLDFGTHCFNKLSIRFDWNVSKQIFILEQKVGRVGEVPNNRPSVSNPNSIIYDV